MFRWIGVVSHAVGVSKVMVGADNTFVGKLFLPLLYHFLISFGMQPIYQGVNHVVGAAAGFSLACLARLLTMNPLT